jgi:hypothetical protein
MARFALFARARGAGLLRLASFRALRAPGRFIGAPAM